MKVMLLGFIGAVSMSGFAAGHSSPDLRRIVYGPGTEITANELRYAEGERTTFARGAVRLVSESSTVTADEADVHILRSTPQAVDLDIVLRGNVRVLVTPLNQALRR